MLASLKSFWKKEKQILKYIFLLFLLSRILLTLVGVFSRDYFGKVFPDSNKWIYTNIPILDIWGIWDSGYYLDLAKRGYSQNQDFEFPISIPAGEFGTNQINYAFFPLYPIFIKLAYYFSKNYFVSGLIVSNVSLLLSTFVLYKLVEMLFGRKVAKRTVSFMFLFPTSFIYSGVFAESLTVLMAIVTSYLSEKGKFVKAGFFASLTTLSKITGILTALFLVVDEKTNFKITKLPPSLFLPPIVLMAFFYFQYLKSGDFFIFFHTEALGWNAKLTNPIQTAITILFAKTELWQHLIIKSVASLYIATQALLLYIARKKIPFSWWIFWLVGFVMPLSSGDSPGLSIPRMSLIFFPQYLLFALITNSKSVYLTLLVAFSVLQLVFMALWVNGFIF